jgi:hypothetical protein
MACRACSDLGIPSLGDGQGRVQILPSGRLARIEVLQPGGVGPGPGGAGLGRDPGALRA